MKTEKKNAQGLYLQRSSKRWKWMAGATAATAAGVTATQASTITINLVGNYISGSGGNHLNADLTGDGQPDLTIANPMFFLHRHSYQGNGYFSSSARVSLNGVVAAGFWANTSAIGRVTLGSQTRVFGFGSPSTLTGSIPIFFKDLHINNGALTSGSLEVTVFGVGTTVQLDSFTYTSTIPDQGSTLALLAMGAGGILALRRWRAAQGRF